MENQIRSLKLHFPFRKIYVATLQNGDKEVFAPKDKRAVNARLRAGEKVQEVIFGGK